MSQISEAHATAARANGSLGGRPHGATDPRPPIPPVTPEQTANLIDQTAAAIVAGETPRYSSALINPITSHDRQQLARFAGVTAEEFTERLAVKLRHLADLTVDRIAQKLDQDKFKPHELSFLLTVGVDKLDRLSGRAALQGANVNVQINNFGPQSKAEIIARLTGQTLDLPPAQAQPVAPA